MHRGKRSPRDMDVRKGLKRDMECISRKSMMKRREMQIKNETCRVGVPRLPAGRVNVLSAVLQ